MKRNRDPTFKADDPQSRTYVIAPNASVREVLQSEASSLDALDIGQSALVAALLRDNVVEIEKVGLRLRRKNDLDRHPAERRRFA